MRLEVLSDWLAKFGKPPASHSLFYQLLKFFISKETFFADSDLSNSPKIFDDKFGEQLQRDMDDSNWNAAVQVESPKTNTVRARINILGIGTEATRPDSRSLDKRGS